MTTGEKLAALRKRKGITQERLSEILGVSRQSVSRWEMDAAFPETEKLIKLSKLLECSVDFLLNEELTEDRLATESNRELSGADCVQFIRECGYFFLATCPDDMPRLRPMGMIYSDDKALYLVTDRRKSVYADLMKNPRVELASYNLYTRKWIRISGHAQEDDTCVSHELALSEYPSLEQKYVGEQGAFLAIYRIHMEAAEVY